MAWIVGFGLFVCLFGRVVYVLLGASCLSLDIVPF